MSVINCMSYLIEYRKKSEIIEITTELSREGLSDDIYIDCGRTVAELWQDCAGGGPGLD